MDDYDKKVLYDIHDKLVGTLDKPGLITKFEQQHQDIYGEPNGVIARLGRMQAEQDSALSWIKGSWQTICIFALLGWEAMKEFFLKKP